MSKTITVSSGQPSSRVYRTDVSYAAARNAANSNYSASAFGQAHTLWTKDWVVVRGAFAFAPDLPDDAVVSAATFWFECDGIYIDSNHFDLVIQSLAGVDFPFTTAVYNIANFSGDGGSKNTSVVGIGRVDIDLNGTGRTWILNGVDVLTILGIRSSREISDTEPTDDEIISFDYVPLSPQLDIIYAAVPSVRTASAYSIGDTTATCRGTILKDHDDAGCDIIGICYNKTGSPTIADDTMQTEGTYYTNQSITMPLTGLDPGTDYYFKAYAHNVTGYGYGPELEFTTTGVAFEITTQAVSDKTYDHAKGNGTIVVGEPTERGFEVELAFSSDVGDYVFHNVAGFEGDISYNITAGKWEGTLTKTVTETGTFTPGAYTGNLGRFPVAVTSDRLFPCESYTYRAYMIIDDTTYHGDDVAFTMLCYPEHQPADDLSDGNPFVPIIPIEPIEWELPEFIWEMPEIEIPPWIFPDLPSWEFPDYPPMSWIGDFYYRKPYTKKDLDDLRKKCIIYNKNSIEFALVLRHNMNVLREFFNMMTDYMDKDEFNDFTDLIPPQRLKELYLDPLDPTDFRDMINGFIRNTIDNNIAVNRNFKLIQDGLSDYETESDDAYFKEINSNIKTVTEDDPDVHRLKKKIDSLNQEVSFNFSNIMRNLKILRARLL